MSNRYDPTHKLASKRDAAIQPVAAAGDEVITGGGQRRRWSSAERARIVRESLEPGAVAWKVAERYGLTRWQLYDWRRKARAAAGQAGPARPKGDGSTSAAIGVLPSFAPVVMATPTVQPTGSESNLVEIAIGGVNVRVRGVVDVDGLVAVLNAVRRVS